MEDKMTIVESEVRKERAGRAERQAVPIAHPDVPVPCPAVCLVPHFLSGCLCVQVRTAVLLLVSPFTREVPNPTGWWPELSVPGFVISP